MVYRAALIALGALGIKNGKLDPVLFGKLAKELREGRPGGVDLGIYIPSVTLETLEKYFGEKGSFGIPLDAKLLAAFSNLLCSHRKCQDIAYLIAAWNRPSRGLSSYKKGPGSVDADSSGTISHQ